MFSIKAINLDRQIELSILLHDKLNGSYEGAKLQLFFCNVFNEPNILPDFHYIYNNFSYKKGSENFSDTDTTTLLTSIN